MEFRGEGGVGIFFFSEMLHSPATFQAI